jgi:two-component system sensor histidine kinase/response regulator
VADDNAVSRASLARALASIGFAVQEADAGAAAVDAVRRASVEGRPFNLVLLDWEMPGMSGAAAARHIRHLGLPASPRLALVTGHGHEQVVEAAHKAGFDGVFVKPAGIATIYRNALGALGGQSVPAAIGMANDVIDAVDNASKRHYDAVPMNMHMPNMDGTDAARPMHASHAPEGLPDAIEGVDMPLGLRRVMGRRDLYLSILAKFVAGQGGTGEAVACALHAQDPATAERLAHTLKGVAGNIGATALQADAAALEAAIRNRLPAAQTDALLQGLAARLAGVTAAISQALPGRTETPDADFDAAADSGRVQEICEALAGLLAEDDSEAVDTFNRHAPLLRAAMPGAFAGIERAIHGFEFREALAALRDGMSHLSATP